MKQEGKEPHFDLNQKCHCLKTGEGWRCGNCFRSTKKKKSIPEPRINKHLRTDPHVSLDVQLLAVNAEDDLTSLS